MEEGQDERAQARGIKIIGARWIDINKGDLKIPNYRSRSVGKEFNNGKDDSLVAATPPLEALRMLVSEAATVEEDGKDIRKVIMINDVARAFFEAKATREVCVEMPDEALAGHELPGEWVALLEKSLYGTRDAALNFQKEVKRTLEAQGFVTGRYNPSTY